MFNETEANIGEQEHGTKSGQGCGKDPLRWAEMALWQIEDERSRNPGYTQKEAAQRLGVHYTTLSHGLRMVRRLRGPAREALQRGDLTLGHGKALAAFAGMEQDEMVERFVQQGGSVRAVEAAAATRCGRGLDQMHLEERIGTHIGVPVSIEYAQDQLRGRVILTFTDRKALEAILRRLGVAPE